MEDLLSFDLRQFVILIESQGVEALVRLAESCDPAKLEELRRRLDSAQVEHFKGHYWAPSRLERFELAMRALAAIKSNQKGGDYNSA